jgi:hypothetical protein
LGGLPGALYKYDAYTGSILSLDTGNLYNLVRGSTFFQANVLFVRGGEVIWLDPDSQNIFKSQSIDNLDTSRSIHTVAYDLAGFSNTLYRLEQQRVYFHDGFGRYESENWAPNYNYNTSSTVPEVYFVAIKADPPVLHHAVAGLSPTPTSAIRVQVLDQFRTPVFNRLVELSSDGGGLSPIQDNTDANGEITSTYTANASIGQVTVTASVA